MKIRAAITVAAVIAISSGAATAQNSAKSADGLALVGESHDVSTATGQLSFGPIAAVAAASESAAIVAAQPKFRDLSDGLLFVYATDDEPLGPRMGITGVSETTLKAVAKYVKADRDLARENKSAIELMHRTAIFTAEVTAVVSILGTLTGLLTLVVNPRAKRFLKRHWGRRETKAP